MHPDFHRRLMPSEWAVFLCFIFMLYFICFTVLGLGHTTGAEGDIGAFLGLL
jgi:hypothetical protein